MSSCHGTQPEVSPRASKTNVVTFPATHDSGSQLHARPTDSELLGRCRVGDVYAWDELVHRYERLIYSVALRNGATIEDAGDITQSTFMALIDALDRIDDENKLASWLMTVARRQSWRVRSVSRKTLAVEQVPDSPTDPYPDWDTQMAVHDALSNLGGTCQELLIALYFDPDEPRYAQIADRMGRSIGGIGPLRGRCLERLRQIMLEGEE